VSLIKEYHLKESMFANNPERSLTGRTTLTSILKKIFAHNIYKNELGRDLTRSGWADHLKYPLNK
jgi:hypothetical protein